VTRLIQAFSWKSVGSDQTAVVFRVFCDPDLCFPRNLAEERLHDLPCLECRRMELKDLFKNSSAGLVFVT